jgi:hypothetical protein
MSMKEARLAFATRIGRKPSAAHRRFQQAVNSLSKPIGRERVWISSDGNHIALKGSPVELEDLIRREEESGELVAVEGARVRVLMTPELLKLIGTPNDKWDIHNESAIRRLAEATGGLTNEDMKRKTPVTALEQLGSDITAAVGTFWGKVYETVESMYFESRLQKDRYFEYKHNRPYYDFLDGRYQISKARESPFRNLKDPARIEEVLRAGMKELDADRSEGWGRYYQFVDGMPGESFFEKLKAAFSEYESQNVPGDLHSHYFDHSKLEFVPLSDWEMREYRRLGVGCRLAMNADGPIWRKTEELCAGLLIQATAEKDWQVLHVRHQLRAMIEGYSRWSRKFNELARRLGPILENGEGGLFLEHPGKDCEVLLDTLVWMGLWQTREEDGRPKIPDRISFEDEAWEAFKAGLIAHRKKITDSRISECVESLRVLEIAHTTINDAIARMNDKALLAFYVRIDEKSNRSKLSTLGVDKILCEEEMQRLLSVSNERVSLMMARAAQNEFGRGKERNGFLKMWDTWVKDYWSSPEGLRRSAEFDAMRESWDKSNPNWEESDWKSSG